MAMPAREFLGTMADPVRFDVVEKRIAEGVTAIEVERAAAEARKQEFYRHALVPGEDVLKDLLQAEEVLQARARERVSGENEDLKRELRKPRPVRDDRDPFGEG